MNVLKKFEHKINRTFPLSLRNVINFQLDNSTFIKFEVPNFGQFEILDFNKVIPILNNTGNNTPINWEEQCSNPYFLIETIENYLVNFFPIIYYSNIIPFARNTWGDKCIYLIIESVAEKILLIDTDSNSMKPLELSFGINSLIDLKKVIKKEDSFYYDIREKFENIIQTNNYFFDIPDAIFEANDYAVLFRKSLDLVDKDLKFDFEEQYAESDENYRFKLKTDKFAKTYIIKKYSDYISSEEFLEILNDFINSTKNTLNKSFHLLSFDICDFGITYVDNQTADLLKANGYLQINQKDNEYTYEENQIIRDSMNLKSELENIIFHLKIVSKENITSEHKNMTVYFFYETNYAFDKYGIERLKKMTLIEDIEKVENGYNLYFTVN